MTEDTSNKADKWKILHEKAQKEWPQEEEIAAEDIKSDDEIAQATEVSESAQGALEHPSYKKLEDELTEMEQKMHDYWNQTLRAKAEVENIQARAEKDVSNARKFALEKFAAELLQVADSLDQGLQIQVDGDGLAKSIHEGLELTHNLMHQVMEKFGIKQMNPLGETFDPNLHEAISMQEGTDAKPNTVITVMQKGYTLNGRVLRPAMVVVAK